jgi:hypothetical protein
MGYSYHISFEDSTNSIEQLPASQGLLARLRNGADDRAAARHPYRAERLPSTALRTGRPRRFVHPVCPGQDRARGGRRPAPRARGALRQPEAYVAKVTASAEARHRAALAADRPRRLYRGRKSLRPVQSDSRSAVRTRFFTTFASSAWVRELDANAPGLVGAREQCLHYRGFRAWPSAGPGTGYGRGSRSRVDTGFRGGWLCPPAPIHLVGLRRAAAGVTVHDRR